MDDEIKAPFDSWAVLELFGHVRLAGHVTEATIGGCSFLRVDVPNETGEIQFTRYFGQGAIYSMTPVTETVARRVGNGSSQPPVKPWELPQLPAAEPSDLPDTNDDDGRPW